MANGNQKIVQILIYPLVIAAGFAAVFALSNFVENNRPEMPAEWIDEDLAVKGAKLRGFAFGAEGLLADVYWMRSLQYVGDKVIGSKEEMIDLDNLRPLNPRLLYPYLDGATDLDPGFIAAYSYGAVVLPAIDPEKAIALTKKGIANNPEQWRLYQYLGYIYWRLKRYDEAAETYSAGARIEGAPPFLRFMAGAMKTQSGSRDTAREIYGQMANDDSDSETQYYARIRLQQLDSLDERDAIREAMKKFHERTGHCPSTWTELIPALRSVQLPGGHSLRVDAKDQIVDPSDAAYLIDKANCDVMLDHEKSKIPQK
jgi:tetratricopeptide (TPR) repeat protein